VGATVELFAPPDDAHAAIETTATAWNNTRSDVIDNPIVGVVGAKTSARASVHPLDFGRLIGRKRCSHLYTGFLSPAPAAKSRLTIVMAPS